MRENVYKHKVLNEYVAYIGVVGVSVAVLVLFFCCVMAFSQKPKWVSYRLLQLY